jgi:hypothetical protein
MLRAVAIKSGIWASARQARHQALMFSSVGAWVPFSIRLIFV